MPSATSQRFGKLTLTQVIDCLMALIAAFPEQLQDMPKKIQTRAYWKTILGPKSYRGKQMIEALCELPAFTNLGPKGKGRAAWKPVFEAGPGIGQIRDFIRSLMANADVKLPHRPRIVYWRDAYGANEQIQRIRPIEHHDYIHNPHRGTTTFQRFQGDPTFPTQITSDTYGPVSFPKRGSIIDNVKYIPRTALTYCRWPWQWLEPEKGKFKWSIIDGTLRAAAAVGQTSQLRFQPYTMRVDTAKNPPKAKRYPPEASVNVPDWYWDTGAHWIDQGKYTRNEPDSNDPKYLQHFGDFVRAFAKRYDGHPLIESIDMAYAGFWGESGGNATAKTAEKLADIYISSFKRTQILTLSTPENFLARSRKHRLGWRVDCFGDLRNAALVKDMPSNAGWNHTYDTYVRKIHQSGYKDAWMTAPVTMETCHNVASWTMFGYDIDRIIEEGYKYHTSIFMPKSAYFPERLLEKLIPFDRKIGYRFAVRQMTLPLEVDRGGQLTIPCFFDNVGCAPIYRPYKLALRFTQGRTTRVVHFKTDIRTWMPGHVFFEETLTLPKIFERGEVKIALGIVDDNDIPKVWMAITGALDHNWHSLTSIDVV